VLKDDVFARLLTFPNVLITGHQAFFTSDALTAIAETTLENISAFARGDALPNAIAMGRQN
jgi:D-lactate dehydrogenase